MNFEFSENFKAKCFFLGNSFQIFIEKSKKKPFRLINFFSLRSSKTHSLSMRNQKPLDGFDHGSRKSNDLASVFDKMVIIFKNIKPNFLVIQFKQFLRNQNNFRRIINNFTFIHWIPVINYINKFFFCNLFKLFSFLISIVFFLASSWFSPILAPLLSHNDRIFYFSLQPFFSDLHKWCDSLNWNEINVKK